MSTEQTNIEKTGGTRFSAGKAIQTWAPLGGLDLVWGIADRRFDLFTLAESDECALDTIEYSMRELLRDPQAVTEDGDLLAAVVAYLVLSFIHDERCGNGREDRRPTLGLDPVFEVSQMGAKKYAPFDYLNGQSFSVLLSSAYRHLRKALNDPAACDEESGLLHLGHFGWNILCLLEFIHTGRTELDDVTPWMGINTFQKRAAEKIAAWEERSVLDVLRDHHSGHRTLEAA